MHRNVLCKTKSLHTSQYSNHGTTGRTGWTPDTSAGARTPVRKEWHYQTRYPGTVDLHVSGQLPTVQTHLSLRGGGGTNTHIHTQRTRKLLKTNDDTLPVFSRFPFTRSVSNGSLLQMGKLETGLQHQFRTSINCVGFFLLLLFFSCHSRQQTMQWYRSVETTWCDQ